MLFDFFKHFAFMFRENKWRLSNKEIDKGSRKKSSSLNGRRSTPPPQKKNLNRYIFIFQSCDHISLTTYFSEANPKKKLWGIIYDMSLS